MNYTPTWVVLAAGAVLAPSAVCLAGPNLMAIGNYRELRSARADGRDSLPGKEVIFSFDDPELDFGRVVVRSSDPNPTVRRHLYVGYRSGLLVIDSNFDGVSVQIDELEIWLRIRGKLEPARTYEWETVPVFTGQQKLKAFPAYIPLLWADGKQIASETTIKRPIARSIDDRARNPRGTFKTAYFEKQTGAAWVVLKPENFGNMFGLPFFVLREAAWDLADAEGIEADMPIPTRYIPFKAEVETKIEEAFDSGPTALEERKNRDGFWGNPDGGEGAIQLTSMIVSTLAELGRPTKTGTLRIAMDWLAEQKPTEAGAPGAQTPGSGRGGRGQRRGSPQNQGGGAGQDQPTEFAVGTAATRLYCLAKYGGLKEYKRAIAADVDLLNTAQRDDGGWSSGDIPQQVDPTTNLFAVMSAGYGGGTGQTNRLTRSDNLASYLAVRALQEAHFAGAQTRPRVWRDAAKYWENAQAYNGGFRTKLEDYGGAGVLPTTGYTAMGVAALLITTDMAYGISARRCGGYQANKRHLRLLDRAFEWLEAYYEEVEWEGVLAPVVPPDLYASPMYIQQLRAMSGVHYIKDKNLFLDAATALFEHQAGVLFGVRGQGGWVEAPSIGRTVYALNTLASGAAPTILQRVIVGDEERGWAQYSFDAPHLVRHIAKQRGRPFNWRRTTIDRSTRELVEVPLLYLNVVGEPDWKDDQWNKIRDYCFAGGTVLLNFAKGAEVHRDAMLTALRGAFPEYELKNLKSDDAIFLRDDDEDEHEGEDKESGEEPGSEVPEGMKVLGNGFRHFVFIPGESWACIWQLYQTEDHPDAFAFVDRMFTYATDDTLPRNSSEPSTYPPAAAATKVLKVSHFEVGGDVPAYPDLLKLMNGLMIANFRVSVEPVDDVRKADLVWVSVTGGAEPSLDVRQKILTAIQAGKYLLIDVVSGNQDWDESFQAALRRMDPGISLPRLRRNNPVFTGEITGTQGFDTVRVGMRKALHDRHKFHEVFKLKPGRCELFELRYNGTQVGVYSAYDLSSGVGYHYFPKCRGVMPRGARGICMNAALEAFRWKVRGRDEEY